MSRSLYTIVAISIFATGQTAFAGGKSTAKQVLRHVISHVQRQSVQHSPQHVVKHQNHFHNQHRSRHVSHRHQTRQVDHGGGGNIVLAYFSPKLGARFEIQRIQIGQFQPVLAARIVSTPKHGSPLRQLGLDVGDVITRMDGIPVRNNQELERHVFDTRVRYAKAGANHVHRGTIYIQPNKYFQDEFYPGGGGKCEVGLRP